MEEVYKNIFKIDIPLPGNPLKQTNSYLIMGCKRNLVIDTGFNCPISKKAFDKAFTDGKISLEDTDFLITHLHADHSGLVSQLATKNSKIYMSEKDGNTVNEFGNRKYWDDLETVFRQHGMPPREEEKDYKKHPGELFCDTNHVEFIPLLDGQFFSVGDFTFQVIIVAGHSPGHVCLYEKNKEIFFSGDHILEKITLIITVDLGMNNPLKDYLSSLKDMKKLNVRRCFPGHRNEIKNFQKRIIQLEAHHFDRLKEVENILKGEDKLNAYQVASKMTWNISHSTWEEISRQQRWFATGEAMAHLLYLEYRGKVKKHEIKKKIFFERRKLI